MDNSDRDRYRQQPGGPRPRPRPRSGQGVRTASSRGSARARTTSRSSSAPPPRSPARTAGRQRRGCSGGLVLGALLVLLASAAVAAGVFYFGVVRHVPDPSQMKQKGRDQTTVVLDRKGRTLAKLYAEQNRTDVPLAKMPVHLRNAVVSTEDQRFYEHRGVDPLGVMRALMVDLIAGDKLQGGSTITQQLVKTAYITPERTWRRKAQEAVLAYRIEKRLTKDEILALYLNTIYFGHGAYGVEAASQAYFGKHASELTLPESAMIAGVLKSPGRYSPYLDAEAAETRRRTVLAQMADQGYVSETEKTAAVASELELAGLKPPKTDAPYFVEYIKALLGEEYGSDALYRGGMTVRTTLDMRMQRAAEKAVRGALNRKGDPSAALVALDPATGEILAMVGGRDFASQQYNVAVQGRRQPGSAFKPFVLATALDKGIPPEKTYESGSLKLSLPGGQVWRVTGAGGGRSGPMRLREASEKSVNSVFAQLILEVGPEEVVATAEKMGITTTITPVPAIALGGHEQGVSPLEMAAAFSTLAGGGVRAEPYGITEVRSLDGKVLESHTKRTEDALDPAVAYLVTDILKGVIRSGTGKAAAIGRPAAGKTGTTQRYRDAWFVGYTPTLAAAVWVGYPDAQREMTNVHGRKVTGGSFPAEIWASFMKEALKNAPKREFARPEGLTTLTYCSDTGLKAGPYCPRKAKGLFLAGKLPEVCDVHISPLTVNVPNVVGMTKEAALAALEKLMLIVKVVEKEVAGAAPGVVTEQSPTAGTIATTQTVVTITVATGSNANKPPKAQFTFAPAQPRIGQRVDFDASASTDDGTIAKYVWEFGDGGKAEGLSASHTYPAPSPEGGWSVTLWVTDDDGGVSAVTKHVVVK